jgi:hypothetical protein
MDKLIVNNALLFSSTCVYAFSSLYEWTCPSSVDTFSSRSVHFYQSKLLELGRAQIA